MKELSLNILDIAENSVKAKATQIKIFITETDEKLLLTVSDNGCGMNDKILKSVENPFYTTRTTRKVGMGIPLLKLAAEQTGGSIKIISTTQGENHGTQIHADFYKNHIDFTPLGDVAATLVTLIQCNPDIDFIFKHKTDKGEVNLDTAEMRKVLDGITLNTYDVIVWIKEYLNEQYQLL